MRTAVGYAGGHTTNPTYHDLANHAEAVRIDFDPTVISFEALLELFWEGHDPTRRQRSSQYRAELFCEDERQRALAEASRDALAERLGAPVTTALRTGVPFHPAEDYHQKWRLRRQSAVWAELEARYSSEEELLRSTAAAKLNGYVGGYGTVAQLERDVPLCGLSPAASRSVLAFGR